jgi:hypothetical protein
MIRGVVNALSEAVVRLRLRGPGGVETDVDAIVDTGFSRRCVCAANHAFFAVARGIPHDYRSARPLKSGVPPVAFSRSA